MSYSSMGGVPTNAFLVTAVLFGAYMVMNIGANDVANAIGPLAAISDAVITGGISGKAEIPFWVMSVGAIGIVVGLALYGPRLIKTVGSESTELDQMRAFSIAMAAAITVIIATQLGLPVSSTHIAVGGGFGVGFLREYIKSNYSRMLEEIRVHHEDDDTEAVEAFLRQFEEADVSTKGDMLRELKSRTAADQLLAKRERKDLGRVHRVELVKRNLLLRIAAAWVITVPLAAILAAMFFFMIRGMLLP